MRGATASPGAWKLIPEYGHKEPGFFGGPALPTDKRRLLTAADLYLAAQLGWAMSEGIVPERPGFAEFVATAFERPAAIRAKAFNDQYMTGR